MLPAAQELLLFLMHWHLSLYCPLLVSRGIREGFDTLKKLFNNLLWLVALWSAYGTLGTHAVANCTGDSTGSMDSSSYTWGNSSTNCLSYSGTIWRWIADSTICFNFNCSSRQCIKLIISTSLRTLGQCVTIFTRQTLWLVLGKCYSGCSSWWRCWTTKSCYYLTSYYCLKSY